MEWMRWPLALPRSPKPTPASQRNTPISPQRPARLGVAGHGRGTGLKLTYNLFDKVFGDGGLKGAAAAQTQASTTLMSAAKELEIAAGRLGGGAIPGAGGGSPGTAGGGGGKAPGLGLGRVLPFAFGLPGLALTAPDIGEAGDAARKSNYDKLEGLGQGLRHLLGLDKLSDAIFGPATKAIENKVMNSTMPADAADRMRERNELIEHVNGGLNPGQRSGVKPGQWIGHADMERAPIGALSMSARIFDQAAVISPVSGSMLSAVAWFCSALTDARRRPTDCLRR